MNRKILYDRQPFKQVFLWVALCITVASVAFFGLDQASAALPSGASEIKTTAVCDLEKQGFTLINAATNQDIQRIENGDVITLDKDMLSRLSIRVDATGNAGSAVLKLNKDHVKIENYLPFTLFGDSGYSKNGVNYGRGTIAAGSHTLEATAYSKDNAYGDICDSLSVDFTIELSADTVTEPDEYMPIACDVVDAKAYWNRRDIHTVWMRDGAIHWQAAPGALYIEEDDGTARLYGTVTKDGRDRNFDFQLSGRTFDPPKGSPKLETHYEINETKGWYYYPTTIGTIDGKDYDRYGPAFQVGIGANMKQPEAFGAAGWLSFADNTSAHAGDINIRLINCRPRDQAPPTPEPAACTLQKDSFVLVDSQTDQDIWKIQDGETIYLDNRKLSLLNIRTNATGEAGSVVMELDDDVIKVERDQPYALFGDKSGDYNGGVIANGYHELTATAYPNNDGTGEACDTLTVRFTIEVAETVTPDNYVPQTCDVIDGVNFNNGTVSTIWLKGGYKWSGEPGVQFIEAADGTAQLVGTVIRDGKRMAFDFNLSGRTFDIPEGSPKVETYYEINDISGWYYYPNWGGVLDGVEYVRKGPSFQVGVGANMRQAETYGASGWFAFGDDPSLHAGDVNIRLVNCQPTDIPHQVASLGDQVWLDENENGIQDEGELGVNGIVVNLLDKDSDTPLASDVTDENGNYLFSNLDPKLSYRVQFVIPDDLLLLFTEPDQSADDNEDSDADTTTGITTDITLESGEDRRDVDAGLINKPHEAASIGDRVWKDDDDDGMQDDDEPGVSGVTVNLLPKDSDDPIISMVTDSDGSYLFTDLDPKMSYRVQFVLPENWPLLFTEPNQGSNEDTDSDVDPTTGITTDFITLDPGENRTDVDAGLVDEPHKPASLGDLVWLDANENGVQDENEAPVMGVIVNLLTKDGAQLGSVVTDADGMYLFDELDPKLSYAIQFVIPDELGLLFTEPNQGDDDNDDSDADPITGEVSDIVLESGEDRRDIDAGVINKPHETASIGDRVWKDDNEDGIQDEGEFGVGGITVNLLSKDSDTPLASVVTESDGSYVFTELDPKESYRVQFMIPEEWRLLFTTSTQGTDPEMDSNVDPDTGITKDFITLEPGENRMDIDAGVQNQPAAIGDFVWLDQNINDIQDPGEPGIADAIILLWTDTDGDGEPDEVLEETTTDADGRYRFTDLNAKMVYFVEFKTPSIGPDILFPIKPGSDPTVDLDPALDSDFDPFTGFTAAIIFDFGEENVDIDGGFAVPPSDDPTPVPTNAGATDTPEPAATDTPSPADTDTPVPTATPTLAEDETPVVVDTDTPVPADTDTPVPADTDTPMPVDTDTPVPADTDTPVPADTDTPMPVDTDTPVPTDTPMPTDTPTPVDTDTPVPVDTDTPVPTDTPTVVPTDTPSAGPEGTTILIGTNTVASGDEIMITLEGFMLDGLGTATIEVIYDPAVLEIVNCSKDPTRQFNLVQCNASFAPNIIRFNITSLTGVSGDVTIAELTFRAIGQNGDESAIEMNAATFANSQGSVSEVTLVNGKIIVSDVRAGDVNCDGSRTAVDAMFTLQHDVGMREGSETCTQPQRNKSILYVPNCDVSGDTQCNPIDALFSLQCAVGLANNSCPDDGQRTLDDAPAQEPDPVMLTMASIPAGTSGSVTIPVIVKDAVELGTATIAIHYDPNQLKLLDCQSNEGYTSICNREFGPGTIRLNATILAGESGDVELAEITFEPLATLTEDVTPRLSAFTVAKADGIDIPVEIAEANQPVFNWKSYLPLIQQ